MKHTIQLTESLNICKKVMVFCLLLEIWGKMLVKI